MTHGEVFWCECHNVCLNNKMENMAKYLKMVNLGKGCTNFSTFWKITIFQNKNLREDMQLQKMTWCCSLLLTSWHTDCNAFDILCPQLTFILRRVSSLTLRLTVCQEETVISRHGKFRQMQFLLNFSLKIFREHFRALAC
jgi:hypothetical protein